MLATLAFARNVQQPRCKAVLPHSLNIRKSPHKMLIAQLRATGLHPYMDA